jgi:D-glycero-alpha-D-manno-heptose-7-phosphate kinase
MEGNIDVWGTELDRTWKIKKQFASGISNSDIDLMYDKAKAAGAVGGKILGAGGGGFMLLYVPEEYQEGVKNALQEYRLIEFDFDAQGSRIIFSD